MPMNKLVIEPSMNEGEWCNNPYSYFSHLNKYERWLVFETNSPAPYMITNSIEVVNYYNSYIEPEQNYTMRLLKRFAILELQLVEMENFLNTIDCKVIEESFRWFRNLHEEYYA